MNWFRKHILGEGSEMHRQIYYGLREYPLGFAMTIVTFFNLGMAVAFIMFAIVAGVI
jgi:hypothetical protein